MTRQPFTAEQRRDIAVLAHNARRRSHDGAPWDIPGIDAALARCGGTQADILAALFTLAGDPKMRTPGLLPLPGNHWPERDGTTTAPPTSHNTPCPDHPEQVMPCQQCRTENPPASPETVKAALDAARAAIRANPSPAARERKPLGTIRLTEGAP